MAETVVVTRHEALVQVMRERGLIGTTERVIPHATENDVRGKHVIGILPLRLAVHALSVSEMEMGELTVEDRQAMSGNGHLSLERTRKLVGNLVQYVVLGGPNLQAWGMFRHAASWVYPASKSEG